MKIVFFFFRSTNECRFCRFRSTLYSLLERAWTKHTSRLALPCFTPQILPPRTQQKQDRDVPRLGMPKGVRGLSIVDGCSKIPIRSLEAAQRWRRPILTFSISLYIALTAWESEMIAKTFAICALCCLSTTTNNIQHSVLAGILTILKSKFEGVGPNKNVPPWREVGSLNAISPPSDGFQETAWCWPS